MATLPAQELSLTDTVPTPEMRAEIDALIQQLAAAKYTHRLRAEKKLEAIGLAAIEPLQEVSPYAETEIRLRARRLVQILRQRFVNEGIPASLKSLFRDYWDLTPPVRQARLRQIASQPMSVTSGVLARLARFEDVDELSKVAALAVLKGDLDDEEVRKRLLIGIQYSQRPACQWIRAYIKSYDTPDESLSSLQEMLKEEKKLMAIGSASTSADVVAQLSQRVVDLLVRAGREEKAFDEMRGRAVAANAPLQRLNSIDWLIDHEAWETIDSIAQSGEFADNALLTYRLAEGARLAGKEERARELADAAFRLGGKGIEEYPVKVRALNVLVAEFLDPDVLEDPTSGRRFLVGKMLQDNRGQFDFAEREYVEALKSDDLVNRSALWGPSYVLSEMLHDQQRDNEAAAVRADTIERVTKKSDDDKAPKAKSRLLRPLLPDELNRYKSRMHYYLACHSRSEGRLEDEVSHLQDALKVEPEDIESLIAMYRAKGANKEVKAENLDQIRKVSAKLLQDIRLAEVPNRLNPNRGAVSSNLLTDENQFAWLVGNTEGDIDEAIRRSEHTVRQSPGDGGVLDTLARCHYAKGNFEKAVELQKQAVELEPNILQLKRQLVLFEEALESSQEPDAEETASPEANSLGDAPIDDEPAGDAESSD